MQIIQLATNNGPHPPAHWSLTTAQMIMSMFSPVGRPEAAPEVSEKLKGLFGSFDEAQLRQKIDLALVPFYAEVQSLENKKLDADPSRAQSRECNPLEYELDSNVAAIIALGQDSQYQQWFNDEVVQNAVRSTIGSHVATMMDIARGWYRDTHPA